MENNCLNHIACIVMALAEKAMLLEALEQQFRRMVFNVVARNQDDHTKNIAFLMDKKGVWRLSPAFDVIYAYNPDGLWTSRHQMTINGKADDFRRSDFDAVAARFHIRKPLEIITEVISAVAQWDIFARQSGVGDETIRKVCDRQRLTIA